MTWLALYFPDLPLEWLTRGQPAELPLAVSHRMGGREVIARCNPAAAACGVRPGLPLQAAMALSDDLIIRARDHQAEHRLLQELAQWAYQFSPQISFEPSLLLLEIGASLKLFGGLQALLQKVQDGLPGLGLRSQWASAPTPMAAALFARSRPGEHVSQTQLQQALAQVPLQRLTRDPQLRRLIGDIGLHTIGECLQLPRPELARRAGPALGLLFERLLGDAPDPREPWRPPEYFQQHLELLAEIDEHTALVFPARRLIVALCGFLRGRGMGTQRLQWCLLHREQAPTCFDQGLISPSRDATYILEMFRERIERVQLPAPVVTLQLRVDDALPFEETTATLLDASGLVQDRRLLERLRNRLGDQQVQGLCAVSDYRPERAWCFCVPGGPGEGLDSHAQQPPWLLNEPLPLRARGQVPEYGGPLALHSLPRRIESGWWDGFDIARDYFVAVSRAGERLWVFRDRRSGRWFLHGLFS
jgi:protein ImuB